ncbi:MAG: hypothetical protein F4X16_11035 [Caldilineaceae bacterium SB0661_bin_34]|nr:hypothetical protein [Caldilineaceae bacterium SB0661_bin_34]
MTRPVPKCHIPNLNAIDLLTTLFSEKNRPRQGLSFWYGRMAGLPYCCTGCRETFSVRIGTALERSKATLWQWVFATHLE